MTISLEKQLEEATVAKKRYRSLFWVVAAAFILVVGIVYYNTVFVYAVLDDVQITREGNSNKVAFKYTIATPGRVDFYYGDAILSDVKEQTGNDGFEWSWGVAGATEISIRSRQWVFPHWDRQTFQF